MRVHASVVALNGQGVLITGAVGSGKSSLTLSLMALGGVLISDDQTELTRDGDVLWARAPNSIHDMIEARGVGILNAKAAPASIVLAIDMDNVETQRLPVRRDACYLGVTLACLHKTDSPAWPAAIVQYLKGGRRNP